MTVRVMFSTLTRLLSNRIFAIVFLFAIPRLSISQVEQTMRYEIGVSSWNNEFSIVSASVDGLYLTRMLEEDRAQYLQLIKLDTAFNENWNGALPVPRNYVVTSRKVYKNFLYVLMRYNTYANNNLLLFVINNNDGSFKQHSIKSYIPFFQTEFEITENAVVLGGYYNQVPIALFYDTNKQRSKVLPGIFNEAGELNQVKINPDNSFDVLISARTKGRQRTIWVKSYSPDGDLLDNRALIPEEQNHLIFGREARIGNQAPVVAGVFGNRTREFSKGIFITKLQMDEQHTRYYSFADMENFFKFMKAKREQRVKSRIERRKIKGKKIRLMYRFLLHELVPYQGNFILLGEAFYPKYQSVNNGSFMSTYSYGAQPAGNGRVFLGYQYTHAIVMCFDKDGNMLWDNSFEINDVRSFNLEQFVKLEVQEDKIAMMYLFDGQIRTKVIKDNQVLEGKTSDAIKTLRPFDVVRSTESQAAKLDYWYKDKLYACGVQEIVNQGIGKRKVFFINKVTFKN
jgi:hypothetical protein